MGESQILIRSAPVGERGQGASGGALEKLVWLRASERAKNDELLREICRINYGFSRCSIN